MRPLRFENQKVVQRSFVFLLALSSGSNKQQFAPAWRMGFIKEENNYY